jgi:hypothetical protein
MKTLYSKKIWLFLPLLMSIALVSCLKDKGYEDGKYGSVRNTEGQKFVSIRTAGLGNVQKSSVMINTSSTDIDTVYIDIDLDYYQKTTAPQTVKLTIDNGKVATYNAANSKDFNTTTTDMARLLKNEVTIPAGERTVRTALLIQQDKFDPVKSYMIPVTITEAAGANLSSNLSTRYFNIIGNPLAGTYTWDWFRFQAADTLGTPHSSSFTGDEATPLPISGTSLHFPDPYLETFADPAAGLTLTFTDNNGVLSNFEASFDDVTLAGLKAGSFTIASNPKIVAYTLKGNAANHYSGTSFRIFYSLVNSGGAGRTFINNYVKH